MTYHPTLAKWDSLADVVSFGVAPAILLYTQVLSEYSGLGLAAILWFAVAGALRLARFNVETTKGYYQGLPITVAGSIIAVLSYGQSDSVPGLSYLCCNPGVFNDQYDQDTKI